MSIFRPSVQTRTSNLFLQQCGNDLVKVAEENSSLATENAKLLEKVSELENETAAYRQAARLIEKGRLSPSDIKVKVATLLNKSIEYTPETSSRSAFSKVSSTQTGNSTRSNPDRDYEDARRIDAILRTL